MSAETKNKNPEIVLRLVFMIFSFGVSFVLLRSWIELNFDKQKISARQKQRYSKLDKPQQIFTCVTVDADYSKQDIRKVDGHQHHHHPSAT